MSDGAMLPLGEICKNASRRFAPPEDGKVWFINTGDVENGRFTHNDLSDWEGLPGQAKKAIVEGDILYSEIRPGNGRYAFVDQQYPNAVVSTKFMVIEVGESILPKYLYHVLTSPELQNKMKLIAESRSGTFPQITFDSIAHLELMVPSKPEQLAVSSLLDAIEGRIRNNQKMNQTLEEIAKAIFKSWFVDFDPVRAKAEGRPTGLPPEISDLFPNELVDSEIGEIPKGWNVLKVKDEAIRLKVGKLYSNKTVEQEGSIPVLDQSDAGIIGYHSNDEFVSASLENPVFTFANHTCKMRLLFSDFGVIQNVIPIQSKSYPTIWFYLRTLGIKEFEEYKGHIPDFMDTQLCFPSVQLAKSLNQLVTPLFHRIEIANKEIGVLSELRDTLLPKLISGELRIPDAEKFLQEAGI
jgi:type I restriction enzyme, S subunit